MFLKASQVRLEDFQSLILLSQSLHVLGDHQEDDARKEGIKRARKQLILNPTDKRALSLGSGALFENGDTEEALLWINKALELYPEDPGILFNGICHFAKMGNADKAFSLMKLAVEKGSGNRAWIDNDPDYDSIREEPRFKALIKKLK